MACAQSLTCLSRRISARLLAPSSVRCLESPRASLATAGQAQDQNSFKVLVVGGGSGGSSAAAKFGKKFGKDQVAVIEPHTTHYYQPLWTLVGGGLKTLEGSGRPTKDILPKYATWVQDSVAEFDPDNNSVTTAEGRQIKYEFMIITMGLQTNYDAVKGLQDAIDNDPQVCSNWHSKYVVKTHPAAKAFKEGNAIFTYPNTPVKCPGGPQKIMYIIEDYFRKVGKRDKANMMYNSAIGVIFGIPKYAALLWKVVESRGMTVNLRRNLIEVKRDTREAVFELVDSEKGETETYKYEMLHVAPPMGPVTVMKKHPKLTDDAGWVSVDKENLQHTRYPNIFAAGDCTNLPTSRTAAGVATQMGLLSKNLLAYINGKEMPGKYNGYTSCPLVTSTNKCILAEFDYDGEPLETFPFDQGRESRIMYHVKAEGMPLIYWNLMARGLWNGPKVIRKTMHLGMGK